MSINLKAAFQHTYVLSGNINYHIVEFGKGSTIVLIAGFPQSWYAWRHLIPLLAKGHKIIAIDLPGQGDSDKPGDGYDTKTTAKRIHALLDQLGEKDYVLIGHDIGSWVGYPFAHEYPQSLKGLVLLDGNIPGVTLQPTITLGPDNWRNWHFLFNPIPDLPEALLLGRERILIEWFFKHKSVNFANTFTKEDLDEYERIYSAPDGLRGMLGYYRAVLEDMEQNKPLKEIKLHVPILAIGGEMGSAPDLFERMQLLGHHVSGGLIKNCGHYIAEEQPEALAREIFSFIDGL